MSIFPALSSCIYLTFAYNKTGFRRGDVTTTTPPVSGSDNVPAEKQCRLGIPASAYKIPAASPSVRLSTPQAQFLGNEKLLMFGLKLTSSRY